MEKLSKDVFVSLFWIIFYSIFQEKKEERVQEALKQTFVKHYGLFFLKLNIYDKNKNLAFVPFILGHSYITAFYEIFPSSRLLFSKSFGLKIFRLWIFEIQGITVSTTYIETYLNKHFKDDLLNMIDITTDNTEPESNPVNESENIWYPVDLKSLI